MGAATDKTATEICEKAILEIGSSEPTAIKLEMYPVCGERNDASAFLRFHGADSGARLAASRMEAEGASGAVRFAITCVRTLIGRKPGRRRVEPSDML
jgi:hypothetical protein